MSIGNWGRFTGGLPEPVYHTRVENSTFILEFIGPRQLLLMEDFNSMVHNQCLRMAHEQGLRPVGEIFITTTELAPPVSESSTDALVEGESLDAKMRRRRNEEMKQIFGVGQDLSRMTVRAEVMLANEDIRIADPEPGDGWIDPVTEISSEQFDEELRKLLDDD